MKKAEEDAAAAEAVAKQAAEEAAAAADKAAADAAAKKVELHMHKTKQKYHNILEKDIERYITSNLQMQ